MAIQECANGHLYDTDQYASCPYCQGSANRINFGGPEVGKTVGAGAGDAVGATVAPASYVKPQEKSDTG